MAKKAKIPPILYSRELSLEEWLVSISNSDPDMRHLIDYTFLTNAHREQYLSSIHERSEKDVRSLIRRFLVPAGMLGADDSALDWLLSQSNLLELTGEVEYYRRLLHVNGPWEGMTWILDLLPDRASMAWNVVNAFLAAHFLYLPDGRIDGLYDVLTIIRTRYLERDNPRDTLLSLTPRDFEYFIAAAYHQLGYGIRLTPCSRDGGFDVEIRRDEAGSAETSLVECKKYEGTVGVSVLRALLGAVDKNSATRGVLITTGRVTAPAHAWAKDTARLDIVGYVDLNRLLNRAFGSDWPQRVDRQIWWIKKRLSANTSEAFLPGQKGVI